MEHLDESILEARRQMEQRETERHSDKIVEAELKQSIYDEEMTIYHIPVRFSDKDILEGKAVIRIPDDFSPCSQEEIENVFFLGNRPQYVYTNGYLDFVLALNWTSHEISNSSISEFAKYVKYMIERLGPQSKIISEEKLEKKECNLVIFKLLANALDGVNYTTMFFTSLEGKLLIGSVSFDQKLSKRLTPVVNEIVRSFRVKAEVEG